MSHDGFESGPFVHQIRPITQEEVEVLVHEAVLKEIEGEGAGESPESLAHPDLAVGVVDAFLVVEAAEKGLLDTAVEAVINAHLALGHGERPIETRHDGILRE
jgi:hypothetical protein